MSQQPDPKLEKAKAYERKHQALSLIQLVLSPAVLILSAATPLSESFKALASAWTPNIYLALAIYFSFFSLWMLIFDFPMAFYAGYTLEKKFELSNHTLASWFGDFLKRSVLSFALSLVLIEAFYALLWKFPETWWLWAWGGFSLVSYGLGKLFPVLIVPIFYKYGPVASDDIKNRIFELAKRYGLPIENVYSLNLSRTTKKANAAFMGMGKTKRVVLSDTLLEHFSADEIEIVVAHELGHFKHKDIWKQLAVGLVSSFAAFRLVSVFLGPWAERFGFDGQGDIAALPLVFLIFSAFYLILMPLQNGFSRWIERAADRFALNALPRKDVFISCMEKLARVNLADPEPNPVYEWLFYDHPAIGKRIQMAQNWTKA